MSYILQFIQKYEPSAAEHFFKLEAEFKQLEHCSAGFPQGRRFQLLSKGQPTNTMVWEGEFASLDDVENALKKLADDPTHTALFEKQLPYIVEMHTEIYRVIDL
jgi:hypothetical protein